MPVFVIVLAFLLTGCGMSRPIMVVDRTFSDLGSAAKELRRHKREVQAKPDGRVAAKGAAELSGPDRTGASRKTAP